MLCDVNVFLKKNINRMELKYMLGLKNGIVKLCKHEKDWEIEVYTTIFRLKVIPDDSIKILDTLEV